MIHANSPVLPTRIDDGSSRTTSTVAGATHNARSTASAASNAPFTTASAHQLRPGQASMANARRAVIAAARDVGIST
jgi:hypothetical protein